MATHSSIPAWRIPRTEEPGGLQSIRLRRAGYAWVTEQQHKEFGTVLLLLFCSGFLAQGMRDPSSQTRDRTCTPCMGRRSLKHWTTREVLWTYVQLLSYLFASLGVFLPCIYVRMLPCLLAVFGHGESEKEMDGETEGSSVGQGTVYWVGSDGGCVSLLGSGQPSAHSPLSLVLLTIPSSLSSDLRWVGCH